MADSRPDKSEETKKCLSILKMLRQQMAGLRGLSLINIERQYVDASFAHMERLQNSLNNLYSKLQENLENDNQEHEIKRKNTRSLKQ
jgi:hypothetical protein